MTSSVSPGRSWMGEAAKRALDVIASAAGLVALSPLIAIACLMVWLEDRGSPLYVAARVGRGGIPFRMLKLRTLVIGADRVGWDSTTADDPRMTRVGKWLRRFKLDELPQLWNVLKGDMSLVGPRPNVPREVDLYTPFEMRLLEVKPGVTDIASIVFADLADVIAGHADPNLAYRTLVRPSKSRLGVFYVDHRSFWLDLGLILLTVLGILNRALALRGVQLALARSGAEADLIRLAGRSEGTVLSDGPGTP